MTSRPATIFGLVLLCLASVSTIAGVLLAHTQMGPRERTITAVVIENQESARPHQKGLHEALFIEEFLVEGGISRFVALFDSTRLPEKLMPVRSLRPYFIDGVTPWASVVFFAGGSPEALSQVRMVPGLTFVNGLAYGNNFLRDKTIAAPHNLYTGEELLQEFFTDLAQHAVVWPPYNVSRTATGEAATTVDLNFLSRLHNVTYTYMPSSKRYQRVNGGIVSEATPANVLVIEIPITGIGEKGRLAMDMEGSGNAVLFRSGVVQQGTWTKQNRMDPFTFTGATGEPLQFADGQTWMTALPSLERVTWK